MPQKIVINTVSSGKFREETINGRPHIVTTMVTIEGDSVMNNLFYPNNEVVKASTQLNRLHAPASHPKVDGLFISASDPLAVNAHNIGAFVRSPQIDGNFITNELAIDLDVANKDDRGKEVVRRIKEGEKIGVSTGLNAEVAPSNGVHDGKSFEGIVTNIKFDHVAILLDEQPAGDHTFTLNAAKEVLICNLATTVQDLMEKVDNALHEKFGSEDDFIWHREILLDERKVVFRDPKQNKLMIISFGVDENDAIVFTGEPAEVVEKRSFELVEDNPGLTLNQRKVQKMDKSLFIPLLIANSNNSFTTADKERLLSMPDAELVEAITNAAIHSVTIDQATKALEKEGMTVNAKDFDTDSLNLFVANQDKFKLFQADKKKVRDDMIKGIVANSKMTKEDLDGMSSEALERTAKSLTPNQDYSAQGTTTTLANTDEAEVDYS